ncbi:MAG: DUF6220 domain-containing protein [Candidatus Limnocylindrales bacterium]
MFVVCIVIQVFLAGMGVFDDPGSFVTHREFGYLIGMFTLVLLILSLVARSPRRLTGYSALLLLQFALQSLLVAFRTDAPAVAALHPLNGFLILLVAITLTRASWVALRTGEVPDVAHGRVDRVPGEAM